MDPDVTVCLPVAKSTMAWSAAERNAYIRAAVTDCIIFSLGEPGMINALLLGACRGLAFCHGAGQKQSMFTQYALQYKLQLIRSASQAIVVEGDSPSNSTIAKSVTLALDDVSLPACGPMLLYAFPVATDRDGSMSPETRTTSNAM